MTLHTLSSLFAYDTWVRALMPGYASDVAYGFRSYDFGCGFSVLAFGIA